MSDLWETARQETRGASSGNDGPPPSFSLPRMRSAYQRGLKPDVSSILARYRAVAPYVAQVKDMLDKVGATEEDVDRVENGEMGKWWLMAKMLTRK